MGEIARADNRQTEVQDLPEALRTDTKGRTSQHAGQKRKDGGVEQAADRVVWLVKGRAAGAAAAVSAWLFPLRCGSSQDILPVTRLRIVGGARRQSCAVPMVRQPHCQRQGNNADTDLAQPQSGGWLSPEA